MAIFMQLLEAHIQQFYAYLQLQKRVSAHTLVAYRTDLLQFSKFLEAEYNELQIEDITTGIVRSWLASLKVSNQTAKTINRKLSSLKSFFKYALRQGLVTKTPLQTIVAPKIPKRLPQFIQEKDIRKLFAYEDGEKDWEQKTVMLVIQLFYETGIRLSELMALTLNKIDFYNKQIKVVGKGNKERIIPISTNILHFIKQYADERAQLSPSSNHFFILNSGKQLYAKWVYLRVKEKLNLVTTISKKSPHILRHSFATHLADNGAELNAIKELLGHSSLAATQVYTHNSIEKLKAAFKKAHPKA